MCHGVNGAGKGDVAADLKLKMNGETDPALLKNRTDGELSTDQEEQRPHAARSRSRAG